MEEKQPRTICLYVKDLSVGGLERVVANLANGLSELGSSVEVLLGKSRQDIPTPSLVEMNSLAVSGLKARSDGLRLRWASTAPSLVCSHGTSQNLEAVNAWLRLKRPFPLMVVEHSIVTTIFDEMRTREPRKAFLRTVRRAYTEADQVIAVSDAVKDCLVHEIGVHSGKILVQPNPVFAKPVRTAARQPQPPSKKTIIGVGRLEAMKKFDLLITAFSFLAAAHADWKLVILGDGPERFRLLEMVDQLGLASRVELRGFSLAVERELLKADLVVHPSLTEASPLVVLESLHAGIPCLVGAYCRGAADIITQFGGGAVVDSMLPTRWAAQIESMIAHGSDVPLKPHMLSEFDIGAASLQYQRLFDSALASKPSFLETLADAR